jgi:hypothetical protein
MPGIKYYFSAYIRAVSLLDYQILYNPYKISLAVVFFYLGLFGSVIGIGLVVVLSGGIWIFVLIGSSLWIFLWFLFLGWIADKFLMRGYFL